VAKLGKNACFSALPLPVFVHDKGLFVFLTDFAGVSPQTVG